MSLFSFAPRALLASILLAGAAASASAQGNPWEKSAAAPAPCTTVVETKMPWEKAPAAPTPCTAKSASDAPQLTDAALFARYDITEDGWLSGTELTACACASYDTNRDHEVTRAEFLAGRASAHAPTPAPNAGAPVGAPKQDPVRASARPVTGKFTAPPLGTYRCAAGVMHGATMMTEARSEFQLLSATTFTLGSAKYSYAFDSASGEIRWLSGPWATPYPTSRTDVPTGWIGISRPGERWDCRHR